MVLASLIELSDGKSTKVSGYAIKMKILSNYKMKVNYHFKRHLKNSFSYLESEGLIKKIKQSYKITPGITPNTTRKSLKKLKRKRIKKIRDVKTKKAKLQKKSPNTSTSKAKTKITTTKKQKKSSKIKQPNKTVPKRKNNKKVKNIPNNNTTQSKSTKNSKKQRAIKHALILNQPIIGTFNSLVSNDNITKAFKETKSVWQYYDNNNHNAIVKSPDGWYDYDPKASDVVEEEWQKYIKNRAMCDVRAVKSGQFHYQVDFLNWNQQNLDHFAHTKRKIRRIDENGKVTINPYQ